MLSTDNMNTKFEHVPAEWDIMDISTLCIDMSDGPFGSNLKKEHYTDEREARIVQLSNIGENGWVDENVKYTTIDHAKTICRCIIQPGNIIMAKMMPAGRAIICPNNEKMYILSSDSIKIELNKDFVDTKYFMYATKSKMFQEQIKEDTQGSTRARTSISKIRKNQLFVPKIEEQQKIAEALSDMDNLIYSLEKLIEKKKSIKQGVMQELLTGKKRMSDFSGEWIKINLSKKSRIKARIGWQGLTTAEYLDSGYSYLVTGTDFKNGFVDWDGCYYVEKDRFDQDKNIQIQNDDILITKDGSLGKVAYVSGLSKPATLNSGVFVIRPIQNAYDTRFVYYVLSSFVFKDFLEQLSAGSTIIHLYQKDMNKFEFYIPDDINEQKAIADILFDMDAEITALEQKLVKCQKLKQGMMQQLLNGKIRLVSNNDVVTDKPEADTLKVSPKGHNHQFDDAVVIAGIVDKFYSDKYPLGRKKVQKLLYLFRRHQEADTSAFKKKAAGPYADEVRYKGGEPIAISSKYISVNKGTKGSSFSKGEKITDALTYLENWNLKDDLKWLCEQFKYIKTDKLELLATIDMAMCDLDDAGITVTVDSIKNLIKSHSEWKAKLSKSYFKDNDIAWAIKECRRLFG